MSEVLLPGIMLVILKLLMKVFDMRYNLRQNKARILGGIFPFGFFVWFFFQNNKEQKK